MAIEKTEGGVLITGPHIHYARFVTVAAGLALEINTGMKVSHGRSLIQVANNVTGGTKRTKIGALQDLHDALTQHLPSYKPLPSVVKALGLVPASAVKVDDTIYLPGWGNVPVLQIDTEELHGKILLTVKAKGDGPNAASVFGFGPDELVAVKR